MYKETNFEPGIKKKKIEISGQNISVASKKLFLVTHIKPVFSVIDHRPLGTLGTAETTGQESQNLKEKIKSRAANDEGRDVCRRNAQAHSHNRMQYNATTQRQP